MMKMLSGLVMLWLGLSAQASDIELVVESVGFIKPESVVHDTGHDVYLVSNINGAVPGQAGKGFISRISPEGKVLALKWIDGAAPGVELYKPSGLAVSGNTLYVADGGDQDHPAAVRLFDLKSGKSLGAAQHAPGINSNSLVVMPNGDVLGTYSAWKVAPLGSQLEAENQGNAAAWRQWDGNLWLANGQDAIYRVSKDLRITPYAKNPSLRQPNGITLDKQGNPLVVSSNGGIFYRLNAEGQQVDVRTLPHLGFFDGIAVTPDNTILISHHKGLYKVTRDGLTVPLLDINTHVADFSIDSKRQRLLLPLIYANKLIFARVP